MNEQQPPENSLSGPQGDPGAREAATEPTEPPEPLNGPQAPTQPLDATRLRAEANEWRQKAIRRALAIAKLRGTIDACTDLAGEDVTDRTPWGDGYRAAIADLREVLREFGQLDQAVPFKVGEQPEQPARTTANNPATSRDAADNPLPHSHRDCPDCDVTDPCPCCGLALEELDRPADTAAVHRYRTWLAAEHAKAVARDQAGGVPDELRISPHNGIAAGLHTALWGLERILGAEETGGGPSVAEAAADDRRWFDAEREGS